ncbi:MAG: hypothetical protein OES79_06670, partial [Planctomycetota bacterium]|nr:hypothetical protein [Planctomycetota bacterium]
MSAPVNAKPTKSSLATPGSLPSYYASSGGYYKRLEMNLYRRDASMVVAVWINRHLLLPQEPPNGLAPYNQQ